MEKIEYVNVLKNKKLPDDYHCECDRCRTSLGELRRESGEYYSRLERRKYYAKEEMGEAGHIAKTPLHIARWAVQEFTDPGDWVLDPTMGAGTTAVEALIQGRNAFGVEIQYIDIIKANIAKNMRNGCQALIVKGDARDLKKHANGHTFKLVVNNPPYSGDEGQAGIGKPNYSYQDGLPNLAFFREGKGYEEAMLQIYTACAELMEPGGHLVIGVKDMMRNKKPYMLHTQLTEIVLKTGLEFVGTALLKHHPTTLFINTYERRYGVMVPMYQTIV